TPGKSRSEDKNKSKNESRRRQTTNGKQATERRAAQPHPPAFRPTFQGLQGFRMNLRSTRTHGPMNSIAYRNPSGLSRARPVSLRRHLGRDCSLLSFKARSGGEMWRNRA